ncbi:hypothetical protein Nepgr_004145 [Nepenthes gracilis]|uniref:Uncharacterized protein n=1 Tax=Nepenthes gracilis TaxID=150966 RepID=A0AAD3S0X7_NEPGR|nr:hypothetical protein Nepgr_004145 [Nepenthes gracilis]
MLCTSQINLNNFTAIDLCKFYVLQYGGVIGAFNCQGAAWDPNKRRIKGCKECYKTVEGSVHANDIEWDQNSEMGYSEDYVVYLNQADSLLPMASNSEPNQLVLHPSTFELFSFVPVKKLNQTARGDGRSARVKIKGGGSFLAYSNERPRECFVNGSEVGFEWLDGRKLVVVVPWIEESGGVCEVVVQC